MQRLPQSPNAIQHSVVHEEYGIVGAAEEVTGITTDREVASGVQAEEAITEAALELILEALNVLGSSAKCDVVEVLVREPVARSECREVALETSWVVSKGGVDLLLSVHGGRKRAEVGLCALERSAFDAASSFS